MSNRPHNDQDTCPCCRAKTVEYKHGMTKGLVAGLMKFWVAGSTCLNLADINLTRNEWDNFQKLKYWGLVSPCKENGVWRLRPKAERWLLGRIKIPKYVWTYRGEVVEYTGTPVSIDDIDGSAYEQRHDFGAPE